MVDEFEIPAYLRGSRPGPKPGPTRWKKLRAARPEVEGWENAERWEVDAGPDLCLLSPYLPAGTYRYWVITGRKWVQLRDGGFHVHRLPVSVWERYPGKRKV